MFLTIYNPEGIHTKDNPCSCKNCIIFPEFFHASAYYTVIVHTVENGIKLGRELINDKYPDGVLLIKDSRIGGGSTAYREDGSSITYNREKHQWFNEDGTSHSRK